MSQGRRGGADTSVFFISLTLLYLPSFLFNYFVSGLVIAEHTGTGVCSIIGSVSVILLLDIKYLSVCQCWASYSNNVIYYSLLVTHFKSNIVTLLL